MELLKKVHSVTFFSSKAVKNWRFCEYMGMKCRRQKKYRNQDIASLWEVHLNVELWKRVVDAANAKECSFTWITRYCLFRLVQCLFNIYIIKTTMFV